MERTFIKLGAVTAFLAVLCGAFGAHLLRNKITGLRMEDYQIGVHYQMFHALGLMLVGLCAERLGDSRNLRVGGWLLFVGTVLFCGSLYGFALSGMRNYGIFAPFGGMSLMVGWLLVAAAAWKLPPARA